ncbi:uncharacterized protein LOC131687155 [Topomyia yanbarensis]|uniref:uncharacterized protein LOC131687155 n=1 Tax=Topomyia yanbarensis TaxID=2498891 RepID=UPI00273A9B2B|nr:uncharacterized protein LOC131687155 [Topomyia yanbarensis]
MDLLDTVEDYHSRAASILPSNAYEYISGAAGRSQTLQLNRTSYDRIRIRPRELVNVERRQLSSTLLGMNFDMPVGISPTALHRLAHADGELATARAAEKMRIPYVLSMFVSTSIEQVAQAAPAGIKWMQLYLYKDRRISEAVVRRAEQAGFKAVVLTIDNPVNEDKIIESGDLNFAADFNASTTWTDVEWLISITTLPIIVKGVMTKEDALRAVKIGVNAIIVSNHGGRQLDSVSATIEVLPDIVAAVQGKVPIIIDGGVTKGTDIFKALAMGANMVFIGRAPLWGLTVNGQAGVEEILRLLQRELDNTMALAGCRTVEEITKDQVLHEAQYCLTSLVTFGQK